MTKRQRQMDLDDIIRDLLRQKITKGKSTDDLTIKCMEEEIKTLAEKYHFFDVKMGCKIMGVTLIPND